MDNWNKRGDSAVDEILEELRGSGQALPKTSSKEIDDIMAELGLGHEPAPRFTMPTKAKEQEAFTTRREVPAADKTKPKKAAEVQTQPKAEALLSQRIDEQRASKPKPVIIEEPARASIKEKKDNSATSIWDIEVAEERAPAPPRVGKAAAFARVKHDKYVGDTELESWFADAGTPLSRKEQRQLDKEQKREIAQQKKDEKRQSKAGRDEEYKDEQLKESLDGLEGFAAFAPKDEINHDETVQAEEKYFEEPTLNVSALPQKEQLATPYEEKTAAEAAGNVAPQEEKKDTLTFSIEGEEPLVKVPTAAYTQEFESAEQTLKGEDKKSLYVDEMVDERFRDFFAETVMVNREEEEEPRTAKKRGKKSRSALLTGEFSKLAEQAEQAGYGIDEDDEMDDYSRPQDAAAIERDIISLRGTLLRRTIFTGIIAALLLWMGLAFAEIIAMPAFISPAENPFTFAIVYVGLVILIIAINFTTLSAGLVGLFGEPTIDTPPALAAVGALLQGVVFAVQQITAMNAAPLPEAEPAAAITLFGGVAAVLFVFNAFGKRMRTKSILANFKLASAGINHSAAYVLDNSHELAYSITKGLEEEDPTLLISRPTALVKGFLRQSFSPRKSDQNGRLVGWILLGASIVAAAVAFIISKELLVCMTTFAAVLCIGAPMSSSLVSAVPSAILQKATARVGAVVPGWSAIEELGQINVVMAGGRDIFPPSSVRLCGIKTFEKERIDLAILYAASVLIEGCDTMRDIFMGVIQSKSDMLYKVESLQVEPSRGFTAWVENSRIVIGSREMLQKHDIDPPPVEIEMKYVKEGCMPMYLAVSGKLFAMFIVGYNPDPEVQDTLDGLVRSGVSLLVTSDDMNVTNEVIESTYGLPRGVVKVLGRREVELMEPLTEYLPESEGVMTHIGTFSSFIGGMRAAASCAAAEQMSGIVQIASVLFALVLCGMLMFSGGLVGLSLAIVLLYQAAWTLLASVLPLFRKG